MTIRIAIILGLGVLVPLAGDLLFNGGGASLFLMRKFTEFIEYLAFWR